MSFDFKLYVMNTSKTKPILSLMIYENNSDFYIETNDVIEKNKKFYLSNSRPMESRDLDSLRTILSNQKTIHLKEGLIPKELLYWNDNELIWCYYEKLVHLYFKDIDLASGKYFIPNIIFQIKEGELFVYATKTKRINTKTKLYKAPFPNIYDNNKVCVGNVDVKPEGNVVNIIDKITKNFFSSYFNKDLALNIKYFNEYKRQESVKDKKTLRFDKKKLYDLKLIINDII